MTPLPRFRFLAGCVALLLGPLTFPSGGTAAAQSGSGTALPATDLRGAARQVIDAARYAAFITLDPSGHPRARTVQPVAPDSAMVVWFATNPLTRKVDEVGRDSRVSLYYFDPSSLAYVTLVGRARIVRNRAEQDRHWNAAWDAFYPDRSLAVLVEVTPDYLEVVDIKRGIRGDSVSWRPPTMPLRTPPRRR